MLTTKTKKIAPGKDDNAFWHDLMRQSTEKTPGAHHTVVPALMSELEKAGRRLEQDPGDNYVLALVTSMILNKVYLAKNRGDDHYKRYFPKNKKTGEIKDIKFTAEYLCQHERENIVPVYITERGAVRAKIHCCGKAWSCPICASKIAIRRNEEVHIIISKARALGMTVFLVTLTTPHFENQPLLQICDRNQQAYLHLFNSGVIKALKKRYKWFGSIKAMETNIGGKNGFHNHFHVILIFDTQIDFYDEKDILQIFQEQWKISCIKYGIIDADDAETIALFDEQAVDLKKDFDPSYIAKQSEEWKQEHRASENWGAPEELTLGRMKKSEGSCTAFGFVARMARRAARGCYTIAEMERDAELFIEYACAMHGRSMIQFSKNLRKWAGLTEEKTDKDICDEQNNSGELIGGFNKEQHTFVRKHGLWRPFKKLLMLDMEHAIKTINEIFEANSLHLFYSRSEMEGYIFGNDIDFPEFDPPVPTVPPPK